MDTKVINRRVWLGQVAAAAGGALICGSPLAALASVAEGDASRCEGCGRCMPCRYGVDIPGMLRYHQRAVESGIADEAHAREYLAGMNREVGHRHAAHRCISCWHCVGACPNGIFIAKEMRRLTELTDKMRIALCHE